VHYCTADAAHLDAVIIANPKVIYTTNILRSSVGCLFTNQIASGTTAEISFQKKEKSISTVPHCKIQQRIIRRITPRLPH
jgi:tRNA G18 (ribose-2'-O)-methylase SpoU